MLPAAAQKTNRADYSPEQRHNKQQPAAAREEKSTTYHIAATLFSDKTAGDSTDNKSVSLSLSATHSPMHQFLSLLGRLIVI